MPSPAISPEAMRSCPLPAAGWRVVLDESQRMPKPAGVSSAMTAIAKACEELSRTHSWCMSGTVALLALELWTAG